VVTIDLNDLGLVLFFFATPLAYLSTIS